MDELVGQQALHRSSGSLAVHLKQKKKLLMEVVTTVLQPLKNDTLGISSDMAKSKKKIHGEKFQLSYNPRNSDW